MVCESLAAGAVPFVVGGGNDQSYPNVCALLASQRAAHHPIGVINIDAHLDVREPVAAGAHSGSPFRLMCEDARFAGSGSRFVEFACQGMQCSAEHARWVEHKGHSIMWLSEIEADPAAAFRTALDRIAGPGGKAPIFVSFDIDSIDSAHCPGVSCPAPVGLTARQACQIAFIAGADPRVALIDVSEFNPLIEEYRTGRLVAAIFTNFAEGLATRTMTAAALPQ
jgi:formiminoglutamase